MPAGPGGPTTPARSMTPTETRRRRIRAEADDENGILHGLKEIRCQLARTPDQADGVVFDASDNMPVAMRTAFHQAVLEIIAEPQLLTDPDGILEGLEGVRCRLARDGAYHSGALPCDE